MYNRQQRRLTERAWRRQERVKHKHKLRTFYDMLLVDEKIASGRAPAIKHHLTFEPAMCLAQAVHHSKHGNSREVAAAKEYLAAHETVVRGILERPAHSPAGCLTCSKPLLSWPAVQGLFLVIPLLDANYIPVMGGGICETCCTDQDRVTKLLAAQLDMMGFLTEKEAA